MSNTCLNSHFIQSVLFLLSESDCSSTFLVLYSY
ncbi:unnamed protein product (macronuclear) [Paramecium tetraurelia]|uniref:Uncharacterized protein n=1 Tax=Paramecium tetraurelia TaxID=5888 RepID=A0E3S3_PARTE|nr:uncharacterized protein GSPATT00023113001 [Paramecium tetraurelia]CAK89940.1 unnamed protein product [Paramecium tetraurelia]